jgi:probable pyridine nucleotide-disulfide oxidoreductase
MASVLRARTTGETRGFMKAIIDARSDHILGFTMLGAGAGEVIAAVQIAMLAGLPYVSLRDAILTHPTMTKGLTALLGGVPPKQETTPEATHPRRKGVKIPGRAA